MTTVSVHIIFGRGVVRAALAPKCVVGHPSVRRCGRKYQFQVLIGADVIKLA